MVANIEKTSGIAQSTSLRPLAFLLYINDFPQKIIILLPKLFANEIKISYILSQYTDSFSMTLISAAKFECL